MVTAPIRVPLAPDLAPATFVDRPNRFLVLAALEEGQVVECHLPDPGRLKEMLVPGRRLLLEPAADPDRRTRWTVRLVEAAPEGSGWVSVDTGIPNRLIEQALRAGVLDEFREWAFVRREVTRGGSRFDFLLERPEDDRLYLEVKSVTLVEGGVGLFPDAVTARGTRHVRELTEIVREGGHAAVLFVLQRPDARAIRAARRIDPDFARELARAEEAGVRILGRRCTASRSAVTLGEPVPAGAG
jgi:sugar fermentation stimulation protein A